MAKRPYDKRPTAEPTYQVTQRIPATIYERLCETAAVYKISLSALLIRDLMSEYGNDEVYYANLKAAAESMDAMDER